jgi:hypothetical protein
MDIRKEVRIEAPYYEINREERFYCTILYSLLVSNRDNFKTFLSYLNQYADEKVDLNIIDNYEIYTEYAYLRDLWEKIGKDNDTKRSFIFKSLQLHDNKLEHLSPFELNSKLVGLGTPSNNYIQSPSTWSISKYARYFPYDDEGNENFLKICKFKWSFNIKPDMVIHLDPKRVISIEAKLESKEGYYPSSDEHKKEFIKRFPSEKRNNFVSQTELQSFMFNNLLDVNASIFYLVKTKIKSKYIEVPQIFWGKVFEKMDFTNVHPSLKKALVAAQLIEK